MRPEEPRMLARLRVRLKLAAEVYRGQGFRVCAAHGRDSCRAEGVGAQHNYTGVSQVDRGTSERRGLGGQPWVAQYEGWVVAKCAGTGVSQGLGLATAQRPTLVCMFPSKLHQGAVPSSAVWQPGWDVWLRLGQGRRRGHSMRRRLGPAALQR